MDVEYEDGARFLIFTHETTFTKMLMNYFQLGQFALLGKHAAVARLAGSLFVGSSSIRSRLGWVGARQGSCRLSHAANG